MHFTDCEWLEQETTCQFKSELLQPSLLRSGEIYPSKSKRVMWLRHSGADLLSNELHRWWMIVFAGSTGNNMSIQFKPELRWHCLLSAWRILAAFVTVHGSIEILGSCGGHCFIFVTIMVCWSGQHAKFIGEFQKQVQSLRHGLGLRQEICPQDIKGAPLLRCSSTCFTSAVTFVGASTQIGHRKFETLSTRWSTKWNLTCSLAQSRTGF